LVLLVSVRVHFCPHCPFGFHPVWVVGLYGWVFFTAFAEYSPKAGQPVVDRVL